MINIEKGFDPSQIKVDGMLAISLEKRIGFAEQQSSYPSNTLYPSDTLYPNQP